MMISIAMITYNQCKYLEKALESVVAQNTEYPFEIVIGDDFSTDGTKEIIKNFVSQHPNLIKPVYQIENIGANANFVSVLNNCNGKYIAILEGDDYWTDPNKLQKQVDYLEVNPDCVICHHNVEVLDEETNEKEKYNHFNKNYKYSINELLRENTIATCSVVFRNGITSEFPKWYFDSPIGDYPLNVMLAQNGNIGYLNDIMSVYRKHKAGIHSGDSRIQNYLIGIQSRLLLGENLNLLNHPSLRYSLSRLYRNLSSEYEKSGKNDKAKHYAWKRLFYSQSGQRKLSVKRLFYVYLRHYRKKLISLVN